MFSDFFVWAWTTTHRIDVWYIYLHLPSKSTKYGEIYQSHGWYGPGPLNYWTIRSFGFHVIFELQLVSHWGIRLSTCHPLAGKEPSSPVPITVWKKYIHIQHMYISYICLYCIYNYMHLSMVDERYLSIVIWVDACGLLIPSLRRPRWVASTEVLIPPPCFTCQKGCIRRSEGKRDEAKRKYSGSTQTDRIVCLLFIDCFYFSSCCRCCSSSSSLLFLVFLLLLLLLFFFFFFPCWCLLLVLVSSLAAVVGCWLPLVFALLLVVVGHKRCQCAFRLKKKTYDVAAASNCKWDSDRLVNNTRHVLKMCLI